jgi:hypothetical protein
MFKHLVYFFKDQKLVIGTLSALPFSVSGALKTAFLA